MDIEQDLKEKRLKKTATHGVAQLFNAIAKAQKNQNTSSASSTSLGGGKTKAKFLAELKKDSNNKHTKMTNTEEEKEKKKRKVWEVLGGRLHDGERQDERFRQRKRVFR